MLPPAVVEQQAKLGVSAEESKAQRIQRQQARFRDRGGAFVPSNSNPLVDILLARTVSGESPTKARTKNVTSKRPSTSKMRQTSPTRKAGASNETPTVAGSSKSKPQKRKGKAVDLEADVATKPAPKRRGRPVKGKKKALNADSEVIPPSPNANTKSASKRKGKQGDISTAPSTSDGNTKPKPKAKTNSNPTRTVVEVLVSDDDRTLVEVPHKSKSRSKTNVRRQDDRDTDGDVPIVRPRVSPPADDSRATRTTTRVKLEKTAGTRKNEEGGEATIQSVKFPQTNTKKRLVPPDDDDDDTRAPVAKRGKAANATSAKPRNATVAEAESVHAPRTTKILKNGQNSKATSHGKGKSRNEPGQVIAEPVEEDDERRAERTSKPKKRKKEEDNYDDRPRKAVKFSDTSLLHSSSHRLKENQSERRYQSVAKSSVKDDPDAPQLKLAIKPPSQSRKSKGPPREVLERIRASVARHLQCADSEPDELDCLS